MQNLYKMIQEVYKNSLLEHTQKLVKNTYSKDRDFVRLLQPLEKWTNRDYHSLSALSNIQEASLKRILGYAGKSAKTISAENEAKIIQYLGYGNNVEQFHQDLIRKMYDQVEKEGN